jgi:2-polyprenyl-3-methyl-5-hydroxy-6-metoxy-1,4-benzoquinol methylase
MDLRSISDGLQLGEDGIWHGVTSPPISYPAEGNQRCFSVEENSFWFQHRNRCIEVVVRRFPPPDPGTLFDIGGGNGFVARGLRDAGFDVVVVEPGGAGAQNAKQRGLPTVVRATIEEARFRPASLPAAGLFDVIEHIEDDARFLKSLGELLQPNATLYATVPAYNWLWSADDRQAGHFRRYSLNQFQSVLQSAGFEILFGTYIFRFLPLPIAVLKALPHRIGLSRRQRTRQAVARDHGVQGGWSVRVVNQLLTPEIDRLRQGRGMPFGGSCLVVARRPP